MHRLSSVLTFVGENIFYSMILATEADFLDDPFESLKHLRGARKQQRTIMLN
jgi:hypothetical protein